MTRPTPPERDDSQSIAPSPYPVIRVWRAEAGGFSDSISTWSGVVDHIVRLDDGKSERVDLLDAQGRPLAPLGLELPAPARRPRIGERIHIRTRARVLGIHPVMEGSVVDERGNLIAATVADSHAQLLPPGWTVSKGPIASGEPPRWPGMAELLTPWVIVRHAEQTAWIHADEWRELGDYWIGGRAQDWSRDGNLPPDAGSYTSAWIGWVV